MLNIKKEIQKLLLENGGISMRKLITRMRNDNYDIPKSSTMSVQLNNKRIRFETVQEIVDYLGYELIIREKIK
ncbi:hypothetical protein IJ541_09045 [bacterium]|nr:hypothetical protein [bacterium]